MKALITRFITRFFASELDLRVKMFNIITLGGIITSSVMIFLSAINNSPVSSIINFVTAALSLILLMYSQKSGKYQLCYTIAIICIFIITFPALFFMSGGYNNGMPSFYVFAVVFTAFMLEGKKSIIFASIELIIYIGSCLVAYFYPETVTVWQAKRK